MKIDSAFVASIDLETPLLSPYEQSSLTFSKEGCGVNIQIYNTKQNLSFSIKKDMVKYLDKNCILCLNHIIKLDKDEEFFQVKSLFESPNENNSNAFQQRTEESSEKQYFHFYSLLNQQQNMMQDTIRTNTYYRAIFSNTSDFKDKVILDVGAGSGILSFFAAYMGAKKVYAVEASSMAIFAKDLVAANHLGDIIEIVSGKVEEISIGEPIDTIISEPLGYMLLNERMLETYLHAKKWLKPDGNMFPTTSTLFIAPFTDETLYCELYNRSAFWSQSAFYGIDLTCLREKALFESFQQPIVDTFDVRICMSKAVEYHINFLTCKESDLYDITIPLTFTVAFSSHLHGLAFWFDVDFCGTDQKLTLSTAPTEPLTHWYQVRCLFSRPLLCLYGHTLVGQLRLVSNKRQSYDVSMALTNKNTGSTVTNANIDLKNPCFRYNPVTSYTVTSTGTSSSAPSASLYNVQSSNVGSYQHTNNTGVVEEYPGQNAFYNNPYKHNQEITNGSVDNNTNNNTNITTPYAQSNVAGNQALFVNGIAPPEVEVASRPHDPNTHIYYGQTNNLNQNNSNQLTLHGINSGISIPNTSMYPNPSNHPQTFAPLPPHLILSGHEYNIRRDFIPREGSSIHKTVSPSSPAVYPNNPAYLNNNEYYDGNATPLPPNKMGRYAHFDAGDETVNNNNNNQMAQHQQFSLINAAQQLPPDPYKTNLRASRTQNTQAFYARRNS